MTGCDSGQSEMGQSANFLDLYQLAVFTWYWHTNSDQTKWNSAYKLNVNEKIVEGNWILSLTLIYSNFVCILKYSWAILSELD